MTATTNAAVADIRTAAEQAARYTTVTLGDDSHTIPNWLANSPMYQAVGPVGRFLLAADYTQVVVTDGVPAAEWLDGLQTFSEGPLPQQLAVYLAENGTMYNPDGDTEEAPSVLESVLDATTVASRGAELATVVPPIVPGPVHDSAAAEATVVALETAADSDSAATDAADVVASVEVVSITTPALVPASVLKAGHRAGKLLWGADCTVMAKRTAAGLICHNELSAQREKASSTAIWTKQRASYVLAMEAAVETESGVACTLSALIGTHMAAAAMAELADMDVATWSRGVSFACGRELIPLVERDADTEVWTLKSGITAELSLLARQLAAESNGKGRLSATWCKGKVKELLALHLTRKAEQARQLAATLGETPADKAAKVRLANEAAAADKAAAAKLTPKATAANKAAAATAASATGDPKGDGVKELELVERTLENMGGWVEGSEGADPTLRAAHAWTLVGGSIVALEAFALRCVKESADPEATFDAVDVVASVLARLAGPKLQAVLNRELASRKTPATTAK